MATNLGDLLRAKGFTETRRSSEPAPAEQKAPEAATFANKVVLRSTRRGRGGKTVTEIQGVLTERESLAKVLKKALGVGVTVEDDLLIVQGDQRPRLATWFGDKGVKKVVSA